MALEFWCVKLHNVFSYFVDRDEDARRAVDASWFVEVFPEQEFEEDERYFFLFLDYCATLGVRIKRQYLETWCSTDLKKHIAALRIKVKGCESINLDDPMGFEEVSRVTTQVLLDNYTALEMLEAPEEDFPVALSEFMNQRRGERLTECLSKSFNLLQETNDSIRAGDYATYQLNLINEIYDESLLEDVTDRHTRTDHKLRFITDYGLPAIDADSKGIYGTQLIDIESQPGAGKTRFAIGCPLYTAVVKYKRNVLFCALEQDKVEIEAMFIARHTYELFNIQVNDELILKDKVPDELKDKVTAARIDLFESGKYGKIVIMTKLLYVETIIQSITNMDKLQGAFDIVCIDYVGIIESSPAKYQKEKSVAEIISTSLKLLKRYARRTKKAVLTVSQFNKEGIDAGNADKAITTDMAQGGINVFRHTDYNIAMSFSPEMKAQNKRRFSQPKVRDTAGFGTFIVSVWMGICLFKQDAKKVA